MTSQSMIRILVDVKSEQDHNFSGCQVRAGSEF